MLRRLAAAFIAITLAMPAIAQDYPNHAITLVVPFSAGGPTDTVARLLGHAMSKSLGQPVVVENVGGNGGTLGVERVAHARPDGYTLLVMHTGISTSVSLYGNLSYDPEKDLDPVGLVAEVPMTMVARADFPPNDMKELTAYVKANKDKVTFAHAGLGSASQLCGMLYLGSIDARVTAIPYKGTGPAMTDLIGGQVDFMCDQTINTTSQIKAGKVKAYAITTKNRDAMLPDLPTFEESGFPGFDVTIWSGVWVPHGTPKAVIDKLVAALHAALRDPEIVSRFGEAGAQPVAPERATPAALRDMLRSEIARWAPIVRKNPALRD